MVANGDDPDESVDAPTAPSNPSVNNLGNSSNPGVNHPGNPQNPIIPSVSGVTNPVNPRNPVNSSVAVVNNTAQPSQSRPVRFEQNETFILDESNILDDSEISIRRPFRMPMHNELAEGTTLEMLNDANSTYEASPIIDSVESFTPAQLAIVQKRCDDAVMKYLQSHTKTSAANAAGELVAEPKVTTEGSVSTQEEKPVVVRQVHKTAKRETQEHTIKGITENRIFKGTTKKRQLDNIHNILQAAGLLTLLLGHRKDPQNLISAKNPLGWIAAHVITVAKKATVIDDSDDDLLSVASTTSTYANTELIALPEDDYITYAHDKARLMLLVPLIFDISYHAHGEPAKQANDPIAYYKAIKKYVFGNRAVDLHNAMQDFLNFRLNHNKSVRDECVRWTTIMDAIDDINTSPMSEESKWAFLETHLSNDSRQYVKTALGHGQLEQWNYSRVISSIYELEDRHLLQYNKTSNSSHKVASMKSQPKPKAKSNDKEFKGYCGIYAKNGSCNRRGCWFEHSLDPNRSPPQRRNNESAGPSERYDNSKPTQKPIHLDKKFRSKPFARSEVELKAMTDHAGVPRGKESKENPNGWSIKQLASLTTMYQEYDADFKQVSLNSIRVEKRKYSESPTPQVQSDTTESKLDTELLEYVAKRNTASNDSSDSESDNESITPYAETMKTKDDSSDDESTPPRVNIKNDDSSDDESTPSRVIVHNTHPDQHESNIVYNDRHPTQSVQGSPENIPDSPCNRRVLIEHPSESLSNLLRPMRDSEKLNSHTESSVCFDSDIDGDFNTFNFNKISNDLLNHRFANERIDHSFISQVVSSLHKIYDYYSKTDDIEKYSRDVPCVRIQPRDFMCLPPNDNKDNAWVLCLFGYEPHCNVYTSHTRTDITNLGDGFMALVYTVNSIYLGAITKTVAYPGETFHPCLYSTQNHAYANRHSPGHYFSVVRKISEYPFLIGAVTDMNYRTNNYTNEILIDTMELCIVYDFMAFVAQHLGAFPFNIKRVAYTRHLLLHDLDKINSPSFETGTYKSIFKYIILNTRPVYDNDIKYRPPDDFVHRIYQYFSHRNELEIDRLTTSNVTESCNLNTFFAYSLTYQRFNSIQQQSRRFIIDTGASVSATSDISLLTNTRSCNDMIAYPAFGPKIEPKLRGEFSKLGLDMLVINNMQDTLLSVSQICAGGLTNKKNVAIFTAEGVRVFELDSIKDALKKIHKEGAEVIRGLLSDGIYITQKSELLNSSKLFLAQFKPKSLYDHIHMITGHCGEKSMKWHKQNSLNAQYSEHDEDKDRGICKGCVYGSLSQTPTDQYREHREVPIIPGQCFCLDAYTHTIKSSRGHLYCDIYTDLATRRHYPVFTKNRAAKELTERSTILFQQHPEWKLNMSKNQVRFIRLDSESNYKSAEFLEFAENKGYKLERTPVQDKHANGIAERAVGLVSSKTNIAMMSPEPPVPQKFWDYAMSYACDTLSYNFSSVIGTSPYMKIHGKPINMKYLQPFWSRCYVFIPVKERNKIGDPRAYKAHFAGYSNTTLLFPNYIVIPVNDKNQYLKQRESKNVIFDPTINFTVYNKNEEPYDREFENIDHYVPYNERQNAPIDLQGPSAAPAITQEVQVSDPVRPQRTLQIEPVTDTVPKSNTKSQSDDQYLDDTEEGLNKYHPPYASEDGSPIYWYNLFVRNAEYPLIMCETQNFYKMKIVKDPNVPSNFYNAIKIPEWAEAINKELEKFEQNLCLQLVPYNNQHLVPMMWTFVIKTDGTRKARLVGRGDLMIPYVDFDPNKVYCGNVTACSIKICVTIAAKYRLEKRGGDLVGAYLVTRANPDYSVYIKAPEGYSIPHGMCIQAIGNLYGFPPAGQNFSVEFDKCVSECGYMNTPWDLKFFYKWVDNLPILLIVHSDDFRWFGSKKHMYEWQLLVDTFEKHKYKVTDVGDKEFVGINITRDEQYNYYMDQTRMIDDIVTEAQMKNAKDEYLPYPTQGEKLSKLDNATPENEDECRKFPYRRIVGQLMYGMVHTLVTISYALNVLSRYSNNPGPRHILFAKHLLKYVRTTKKDRLKFETHDGKNDIKTMTDILQLRFQCDADLAGNPDSKHSQTSYLGYLSTSLICWCSTDQGSMSTSTAESELKAVNHTLKCEVIANRGILNQMGWKQETTVIEEDNKACVDASVVPHMTRGMRHIAITENFIKEKFTEGVCKLVKIDSQNNNSDIGTKRLAQPVFDYLTYPLTDKSLREKDNKVKK